jgi:hypothetical protein
MTHDGHDEKKVLVCTRFEKCARNSLTYLFSRILYFAIRLNENRVRNNRIVTTF